MSQSRQYCGKCFALFETASDVCPHCGAVASRLSERDYDAKLLHGLHHPLAEVRLRAVIVLGRRGRLADGRALLECALRHPADVVQALEIIDALLRIARRDPNTVRMLRRLAAEHPAHIIREAAGVALAGTEEAPRFKAGEPT